MHFSSCVAGFVSSEVDAEVEILTSIYTFLETTDRREADNKRFYLIIQHDKNLSIFL